MSVQLTDEQRRQIFLEEMAKEEARQKQKENERLTYKRLASEQVQPNVELLQKLSAEIERVKLQVYENMSTVIAMKKELFPARANNKTNTFTSDCSLFRMKLGYRTLTKFDDTAAEGIALVREFLDEQSKNESIKRISGLLNSLLKADEKGNLDSSRVSDLIIEAKKLGEPKLIEGCDILAKAKFIEKSASFIEAYYRNSETSAWISVPLSVSSIPDSY